MSTRHSSTTITLTDSALTAMLTDAVALTDLLTRVTDSQNVAAITRISSLLERLNAAHRTLTQT